jgi:hypothetical protein
VVKRRIPIETIRQVTTSTKQVNHNIIYLYFFIIRICFNFFYNFFLYILGRFSCDPSEQWLRYSDSIDFQDWIAIDAQSQTEGGFQQRPTS